MRRVIKTSLRTSLSREVVSSAAIREDVAKARVAPGTRLRADVVASRRMEAIARTDRTNRIVEIRINNRQARAISRVQMRRHKLKAVEIETGAIPAAAAGVVEGVVAVSKTLKPNQNRVREKVVRNGPQQVKDNEGHQHALHNNRRGRQSPHKNLMETRRLKLMGIKAVPRQSRSLLQPQRPTRTAALRPNQIHIRCSKR
jgi:hypothetical protein